MSKGSSSKEDLNFSKNIYQIGEVLENSQPAIGIAFVNYTYISALLYFIRLYLTNAYQKINPTLDINIQIFCQQKLKELKDAHRK